MRKTKILAFLLAVIMVFSMVSVFASAAFTPVSHSVLATKVEEPNKNILIDWDFNDLTEGHKFVNVSSTTTGYAHNIATHKDGSGNPIGKTTKSAFNFTGNGTAYQSSRYIFSAKGGALYFDRGAYEGLATTNDKGALVYPDAYAYFAPNSTWITAYAKESADNGVNAVYSDYAGKSFTYSYSLKLDEAPDGTKSGWISGPLGSICTTWLTSRKMVQSIPVAVNRANGAVGYLNVDTKTYVETGAYVSGDSFTDISFHVDVPNNSFDVYVEGVLVAKGIKYLDDATVNAIFGPSASLSTADVAEGKTWQQVAVKDDPLATAEQKANPMLCYTFNHIRILQSCSDSLFIDNVRFYYDDECHETYKSANTVEGYDLTINDGVLGLNYYLNLQNHVLEDENAKVVFTTPRGEKLEIAVKGKTPVANGSYKFTATVSSVDMAGDIKMEIKSGDKVYKIYKNGVAEDSCNYSVKTYAEAVIASGTEKEKTVAKAMLNYGAYAQKYFGFDAENLANANCAYTTELDSVTIDVTDPTQTGTGKKIAKLILDTTTSIVIYDGEGNKIGESVGIDSINLDTAYEIDCGAAGTVSVSVLAVGEKVLASGTASAEYKTLIKALKLFSDASLAYAQQ